MKVDLACKSAYTIAYCTLQHDEEVYIDPGAMALMSDGIQVSATVGTGGVMRAMRRRMLGSESLIMGRYRATYEGAWVACAPPFPGDLAVITLDGSEGLCLEAGSLVAYTAGLSVDVRWSGVSNLALREGAVLLHITGVGQLVVSSYGGLQDMNVQDQAQIHVDTGHLVAYTDTMKVRLGTAGGLITSNLVGEGLIGTLTGPGKVWIQTRAEQSLKDWLFPQGAQNTGS